MHATIALSARSWVGGQSMTCEQALVLADELAVELELDESSRQQLRACALGNVRQRLRLDKVLESLSNPAGKSLSDDAYDEECDARMRVLEAVEGTPNEPLLLALWQRLGQETRKVPDET